MAVADMSARQAGAPHVAHITPHAAVIGGGIAGLTATLSISGADIPVTLVEREPELGGLAHRFPADRETSDLVAGRIAAIRTRPNVTILTGTHITNVSGPVGGYRLALSDGRTLEAGAIVVAVGAAPALETRTLSSSCAFVLCDMTLEKAQTCQHSCCLTTLRQAAEFKRQSPASEVAIFFRELYTAGGQYDELVWEAQRLGVSFYRYPSGQRPQWVEGEIVAHDELTGRMARVRCDQVIQAAPLSPQTDALRLAEMLRLPVDAAGFIADTRVRLRPSDRIERGIYVCGAAHYPCDAQRATFEALSAAARAVRHIRRGQITHWTSAATIDAARCNGCGDCVKVCPFMAVTLVPRPGAEGRLAVVDPLICAGCGNCVSVCPVKAAQVASATDEQIELQIRMALGADGQGGRHLVLACEWSGYSAAEVAGAQGLAYPANTRIIRLNCTGRLQPGLILKALEMGAAGVTILGCAPGVCHYEQGNERCAAAFDQADALARLLAMDDRLKLEWIPPDDGASFVQVVRDSVVQ
jgi:heterodisulfide reductase subunit A